MQGRKTCARRQEKQALDRSIEGGGTGVLKLAKLRQEIFKKFYSVV